MYSSFCFRHSVRLRSAARYYPRFFFLYFFFGLAKEMLFVRDAREFVGIFARGREVAEREKNAHHLTSRFRRSPSPTLYTPPPRYAILLSSSGIILIFARFITTLASTVRSRNDKKALSPGIRETTLKTPALETLQVAASPVRVVAFNFLDFFNSPLPLPVRPISAPGSLSGFCLPAFIHLCHFSSRVLKQKEALRALLTRRYVLWRPHHRRCGVVG